MLDSKTIKNALLSLWDETSEETIDALDGTEAEEIDACANENGFTIFTMDGRRFKVSITQLR
jgi:hypothetical protein